MIALKYLPTSLEGSMTKILKLWDVKRERVSQSVSVCFSLGKSISGKDSIEQLFPYPLNVSY